MSNFEGIERPLFPEKLAEVFETVFVFEGLKDFRESGGVSCLHGALPIGKNRIGYEADFFPENAADSTQGLPLDDHQHGQEIEKHIGAGQKGGQPAERENDCLSGEDEDELCPLPMEEKNQLVPSRLLALGDVGVDFEIVSVDSASLIERLSLEEDLGVQSCDLFFAVSQIFRDFEEPPGIGPSGLLE